jgi:hypothetical protein
MTEALAEQVRHFDEEGAAGKAALEMVLFGRSKKEQPTDVRSTSFSAA